MVFPLDFNEVSLLLAVISFILLVFLVFISSYKGNAEVLMDKDKLEKLAMLFLFLFLATVAVRATASILLP